MKMIIAIVQSKDSNRLRKAFNKADIHVTQLSTTGESREQYVTSQMHMDVEGGSAFPVNVKIGGATVFVLPVEDFIKF